LDAEETAEVAAAAAVLGDGALAWDMMKGCEVTGALFVAREGFGASMFGCSLLISDGPVCCISLFEVGPDPERIELAGTDAPTVLLAALPDCVTRGAATAAVEVLLVSAERVVVVGGAL
jgi:hypothetical protein